MVLRLRRVYDPPSSADGLRVLVDRLWPRGLAKEKARIDFWLKDLAPSAALRKWFGHDPGRWREFLRRYRGELEAQPEAVKVLRSLLKKGPVTLLYAAHDEEHNNAAALKQYLSEKR
jgi:uncharacterized protein YeaO (DUF488 family)